MVSGSLALLYILIGFHGGRQGSDPDRGQSPVEWGDFPSVCPSVRRSVRPSVRPSPPLSHPAMPEAQPAMPEAQPTRPEAQKRKQTDRWTYGCKISLFYQTLSHIGAAVLLTPMKTKKSRAGQKNR